MTVFPELLKAHLVTRVEGGQTYEVSAVPLDISCLGLVLSAVIFVVRPRGRGGQARTLAGAAMIVLPFVWGLLGAGIFGMQMLAQMWSASPEPGQLFTGLIVEEHFAAALAFAALGISTISGGLRRKSGSTHSEAFGAIVAIVAVVTLAGPTHGLMLAWMERCPIIEHDAPKWMHVNRTATVTPSIPTAGSKAWTAKPVAITPPGTIKIALRAEHPLVMVRHDITILARDELGPAAFPIRVGNEWRYRSTASEDEVVLVVKGARDEAGLRVFEIEQRKAGSAPAIVSFAAGDGALIVMPESSQPVELRGAGTKAFYFPFLNAECESVAEPKGSIEVHGPCDCRWSTTGVGVGDILR